MGVNSLWDILGPTARPVRLEALSRKHLAVDASIWIYQFLKAVRDLEGNALPHSHIVGFFRRICKLLYFGIQPIFVFDGGAPALKRETIQKRRERREGHRESVQQTARRLLAVQVQRIAAPSNELTFHEDLPIQHLQTQQKTQQHQPFRAKDEFHLPTIKSFKVSANDQRIMPEEEFKGDLDYSFDYVDGIDINTVDPALEEFLNLPIATQYMILSHLRLKSRLRLGYSKEQLEELFPNSLDFSRFQIQQVQKRNFFTQRLMDVSGMDTDSGNATKRIAGDKDRKYALVKNDDGWTLSLGGGGANEPIVLDEFGEVVREPMKEEPVELVGSDSDVEWEDVEEQESEEDKETQRAIIESIYLEYDTGENARLKHAIEQSKRDLVELKKQEDSRGISNLPESISKLPENQSTKAESDLVFDFGESIFAKPPPTTRTQPKTSYSTTQPTTNKASQPKTSNVIVVEDEPKATKTVVVEDEPKATKTDTVVVEDVKVPEGSTSVTLTAPSTPPPSGVDAHRSPKVTISPRQERGLIEMEELTQEELEQEQEEQKARAQRRQPLPLWFDAGVSQVDQINQQFAPERKEKPKGPDDDVGIMSWREAQELIEPHESDSGPDDEVQELAPVEPTTPPSSQPPQSAAAHKERKVAVLDYDFAQGEDAEVLQQLRLEEEDDEQFRSTIKANHTIPISTTKITDAQLLQEQMHKAKRDSDEVTETMISDVQELLRRFGIPYITAPMEAEAQCAELLKLGLVDGIITDDSDCFLFGGDRVYKNMFNQKQYVECYISSEIDAKLGLSREKLIELALLLGSDYTEGIKGIGPVLGMEILAEFGNLDAFKRWYVKNTTAIPSPTTSLEKNLLNRIKNGKLFLPDSFPDPTIREAYEHPQVDDDKSEFKWGIPDLDLIRLYLMYNIQWLQARIDEILVPLVRDMNRKRAEGTQSTIGEFFPSEYVSHRKNMGLGKRMKSAADKLNKRRKKD